MRFQITVALGALAIAACTSSGEQGGEIAAAPPPAVSTDTAVYTVMVSGTKIGDMVVDQTGDEIVVDYEYRNNGRGPTMAEAVTLDEDGVPVAWTVSGNTTFGNAVSETFSLVDGEASWTDSTGSGSAEVSEPSVYIAQSGTPYSLAVYAGALLNDDDMSLPALPGGTLSLQELESFELASEAGETTATAYALIGPELDPTYFVMDDSDESFLGLITPEFLIIREGFEGNDESLRARAVRYSTERFETLQTETAHTFDAPVLIENVRVFDPVTRELSEGTSVLVEGERIVSVGPATDAPAGVYRIDGQGGTLIPGLSDMHAHMGQDDALLNIAAGVTFVRDMGNDNEVLSELITKIDDGVLAGPRIVKSGFIEGKSPFNSNNGIIVTNQEEALDAVRTYGDAGDFFQIKIYNSMKGEWVPEMVALAHEYGMRVTGHVPAFSRADDMILAGYDELTHINQVMLGWVLAADEDTRTLLRLTALTRLPDLDLNSAPVQETLNLMSDKDVAIDPTLAIHEALLLSRNGTTQAGVVDYIDNMPIGVQRGAKQAWSNIETPEDDAAYAGAFEQIMDTVEMMRDRGIFILFGTDMGGAFTLHRELELYEKIGFTRGEVLSRATLEAADYVGLGEDIGSIEPGKYADFFLVPGNPLDDLKAIKTIRMVMKDGVAYFPSEIHPAFGIEPFTDIPDVIAPADE
ncbi:amidohydrolase family protein [Henriciella litoralis]|uniref:amidohydrolase family protein n=1 Tax=Henriciella litoralis TaxID=568102 RepID=UPI000A02CFF8|nr:amidohydrolase family protein [Henriciella litoralis]